MTESEDKLIASHLACSTCGKIASRDEHRELMLAFPLAPHPMVYHGSRGWEIDTRDGKNVILCPECAQ